MKKKCKKGVQKMYRGKNVRTKVQYFTYVKHSVHFFTKNVRRVKGMYHIIR